MSPAGFEPVDSRIDDSALYEVCPLYTLLYSNICFVIQYVDSGYIYYKSILGISGGVGGDRARIEKL